MTAIDYIVGRDKYIPTGKQVIGQAPFKVTSNGWKMTATITTVGRKIRVIVVCSPRWLMPMFWEWYQGETDSEAFLELLQRIINES